MDQVIELLAFYWTEWQQTALTNTVYSAVLATVAFLTGGFIVSLFKQIKISRLKRQINQGKQHLEKTSKNHQELLSKEKNIEAQKVTIQQQLEQTTKNLQLERNENQARHSENDQLFLNTATKKYQEIAALNTMLDEKTSLTDRLQSDLSEQEKVIAQHKETQEKVVEMERLINQSSSEFEAVKKQLKDELETKNEQIEQSTKIHQDRVLELERQLQENRHTEETKNTQQHSAKNEVQQEEQKTTVTPLINIEKNSEQQDSKTQETIEEQGTVDQVKEWFSEMDDALDVNDNGLENNVVPTKEVDKIQSAIQKEAHSPTTISNTNSPVLNQAIEETQKLETQNSKEKTSDFTVDREQTATQHLQEEIPNEENKTEIIKKAKQKVTLAKEPEVKDKGVVGNVLGWFSSMDKALETDNDIKNDDAHAKKVDLKRNPLKKEKNNPASKILDDEKTGFSEKLADIADTMDSFSDKFKKVYRKVIK